MRRVDERPIERGSNYSWKVFWLWARQLYNMMMLDDDWKYQLACEQLPGLG